MPNELMTRRIGQILDLNRRLIRWGGVEPALRSQLRQALSPGLIHADHRELIGAVREAITEEQERRSLEEAVARAGYVVTQGAAVLTTFAMPLLIRMEPMRNGGSCRGRWAGDYVLDRATERVLGQLESVLRYRHWAPRVVIDPWLYSPEGCESVSVARLHQHLCALDYRGHAVSPMAPTIDLTLTEDPSWSLALLIGALSGPENADLNLSDDPCHFWRYLPAVAASRTGPELWQQGVDIEAHCVGFFVWPEALVRGRAALQNLPAALADCGHDRFTLEEAMR